LEGFYKSGRWWSWSIGLVITNHVIEDICSRFLVIDIDPLLDPLAFEQLEEALGQGVVMTIAATAHAANDVVGFQECPPRLAGELTALIGMHDESGRRLASPAAVIENDLPLARLLLVAGADAELAIDELDDSQQALLEQLIATEPD
jgi:hypothetical protein